MHGALLFFVVVSIFDLSSQSFIHLMHYDFVLSSAAVKNVRIKTLADVLPVHLLEELGLLVDAHVLHEFLDGSYL